MQTQLSTNKPAFGRIITGQTLKKTMCNPNCPRKFINRFVAIKQQCVKKQVSKTNNINILLDYSKSYGYYAAIISKKGDILTKNENQFFKNINPFNEKIKELKDWATRWDNFYQKTTNP